MIRNTNFEIVKVADDYIAVPISDEATSFHGVVALSEAAAFLLGQMNEYLTIDEMVGKLMDEYDVDRDTAEADVKEIVKTFIDLKLVFDS